MALVARYFKNWCEIVVEIPDPRLKTLPLSQPIHCIAITALYIMFIYKWGPMLMKNRPPFKIDKIVMIYNVLQVLCCAYVFIKGSYIWFGTYKPLCQPIEYSRSDQAWYINVTVYQYYLLKVADLCDTVFFVLRKKFNHISFLHVYHHAGMVCLSGGSVNYAPGGHAAFIGVVNCFVHCIMYSYYFLTSYNPEYKKKIWWKKYVTQLQIVQLLTYVVHMTAILFVPDCGFPKPLVFLFVPQNLFMLILFIDFYIKTYVKKPQKNHIKQKEIGCEAENENKKAKENDYVEKHILNGNHVNDLHSRNVKRS